MKLFTKLTIAGIIAVLLVCVSRSAVIAQTRAPNPTRAALREQKQQERVELRRDNADLEITRRLTGLNNLIVRINRLKHITAEQKAEFVGQINTEITNLQNLKTKIDADTDPTVLLADKKSIVQSYRVYVVFMPKIMIMSHADNILEIATLLQTRNPSGDAASKITDAITQANNAISLVAGIEPSGYPNNIQVLKNARTMLQTARLDLESAWAQMKKSPTPTQTAQ